MAIDTTSFPFLPMAGSHLDFVRLNRFMRSMGSLLIYGLNSVNIAALRQQKTLSFWTLGDVIGAMDTLRKPSSDLYFRIGFHRLELMLFPSGETTTQTECPKRL